MGNKSPPSNSSASPSASSLAAWPSSNRQCPSEAVSKLTTHLASAWKFDPLCPRPALGQPGRSRRGQKEISSTLSACAARTVHRQAPAPLLAPRVPDVKVDDHSPRPGSAGVARALRWGRPVVMDNIYCAPQQRTPDPWIEIFIYAIAHLGVDDNGNRYLPYSNTRGWDEQRVRPNGARIWLSCVGGLQREQHPFNHAASLGAGSSPSQLIVFPVSCAPGVSSRQPDSPVRLDFVGASRIAGPYVVHRYYLGCWNPCLRLESRSPHVDRPRQVVSTTS